MNRHSIPTGRFLASALILITFAAAPVMARSKQPQPAPGREDSIDIAGHLALPASTNQSLELGSHWDRNYLFLSDDARTLTVVDVSDPARPAITEQGTIPEAMQKNKPLLLVGTAGLLVGTEEATPAPAVKTISIIQWNGSKGARIIRQFDHVSAYRHDPARSLVYVIDSNELWVLRIHAAPDPRVEEAYTHHVLYDR